MALETPPDRGHVTTEHRHDASRDFDALATADAIDLVIDDHARVLDALRAARDDLAAFIDDLVPRVRGGGRLVYVGAGTSGRLGVLDAAECPPTFRSDPATIVGLIAGGAGALVRSSEGREDEPDGAHEALDDLAITAGDTVLGIAAGGTTPYVRGAIDHARARGAATALLTCATSTTPPDGCDRLIVLDTGPELLTGSTRLKAATATKVALNTITTLLFVRLGKVHGNLMVDLRATNDKLTDRAIRILREIVPALSRADAHETLRAADGVLKTAIVMAGCAVDRTEAERRLAGADGALRAVLDR